MAESKYAAAFLELGVSAKALALGGAYATPRGEAAGFYWNPACLGTVSTTEISGMYSSLYGSISKPLANFNHIGVSTLLPGNAHFAVNWLRFTVDDIPIYPVLKGDSYGQRLSDLRLRPDAIPSGYFMDIEEAFFFSFALTNNYHLPLGWLYLDLPIEIPIGINLKWIRQRLFGEKSSGIGIDLGAMIRFDLGLLWSTRKLGHVSFGISAIDLTQTVLTWSTDNEETIERNLLVGTTYEQPLPAQLGSLNLFWARSSRFNGAQHYGIELDLKKVAVRFGLNDDDFSAGAGLNFWKVRIDYAFITQDLGNSHRIGGAFSF